MGEGRKERGRALHIVLGSFTPLLASQYNSLQATRTGKILVNLQAQRDRLSGY